MSQFANLEANSVVAVIQDYRRASRVMFALSEFVRTRAPARPAPPLAGLRRA